MKLCDLEPLSGSIGADCRHTTVFNVLKFKGFRNFNEVWKQCGLIYTKKSQTEAGVLRGKFMDFVDELNWIHRIKIIPFFTKDRNEFLEGIKYQLDNEEPVLLHVDSYNLVGNQFYKLKSMIHMITLINYKGGMFTYIDETYLKKETITEEELSAAAWVNRNFEDQYNYFILCLNKAKFAADVTDGYNVINRNKLYIEGTVREEHILSLKELYRHQPYVWVGKEAIEKFMDDYRGTIYNLNNDNQINFDNIYLSLLDVSVSHYRFASFLKNIDKNNTFKELVQILEEIAQEWKIASNMMIKAIYKKDLGMIDRIVKKVENAKAYEDYLAKVLNKTL